MELPKRPFTQLAATFMLAAVIMTCTTAARTMEGSRIGRVGTQGNRHERRNDVETQGKRYNLVLSVGPDLNQTVEPRRLTVGGELGWRLGVDYGKWAADNEVRVTDILVFKYNNSYHTLATFNTKDNFDNCNFNNLKTTRASGFSNVLMVQVGPSYYACTVGHHCKNGMKMMIDVKPMAW